MGIPDPDIMTGSPLAPGFRRKRTSRPGGESKKVISRCFRPGAERGIPFFPPGEKPLLRTRMVEFMQGEQSLPVRDFQPYPRPRDPFQRVSFIKNHKIIGEQIVFLAAPYRHQRKEECVVQNHHGCFARALLRPLEKTVGSAQPRAADPLFGAHCIPDVAAGSKVKPFGVSIPRTEGPFPYAHQLFHAFLIEQRRRDTDAVLQAGGAEVVPPPLQYRHRRLRSRH